MVRLEVTGGRLTQRLKSSLRCILVEVPWQINEYLNFVNWFTNWAFLLTGLSFHCDVIIKIQYLERRGNVLHGYKFAIEPMEIGGGEFEGRKSS